MIGLLRISSRIHGGENELPECVKSRRNSDKLLSDVADSFSHDAWAFEFLNTPMIGLRENSNPDIRHENESGKSSKILSFICPNRAYLRYDRLANFGGVEFSDSPMVGVLRNSSRNSGSDQEWPEFVYFEIISVKITTNVPDLFSRDACGFEFRNGPMKTAVPITRRHDMNTIGTIDPRRAPENSRNRMSIRMPPNLFRSRTQDPCHTNR